MNVHDMHRIASCCPLPCWCPDTTQELVDPCGLAEGCVFMLFPGCVFEGGRGKMSCRRRGGRWNEDDLVESSASDLLRNVSCKHLFFLPGLLLYQHVESNAGIFFYFGSRPLKLLGTSLSQCWGEHPGFELWTLHGSLYPGSLQQAVGLPGDHWNHQDWWVPWSLDWHSDLALCSSHACSPLWPWPMVPVGWQMGHSSRDFEWVWNPSKFQQWSMGALIHVPNFWGGDSQVLLPNLRSPNANATRNSSWFENRPPSRERRPQRKRICGCWF